MDHAEKEVTLKKMKADRGWLLPEQVFNLEKDPEYQRLNSDLFNHVIKREGALSEKFRELIIIAALCTRLPGPEVEPYVKNHIRRVFELGGCENEIYETVQCLVFPAGSPSFLMGVKCLCSVLDEHRTSSRPT